MAQNDASRVPEDPIEAALHEFREAWHAGKRHDPDAFCESRPGCGPELREKIESFLLAVKDFSEAGVGKYEQPTGEPVADDTLSGKKMGDFKILREIGRGGMGVVYEAEQISLHRRVALKVLYSHLSFSENSVLKFRREAEAGGRQQHPGIVSIYAVGEHEGIHYIAQELVEEGRTIEDKLEELQREDKLPIGYFREAAGLVAEVADALSHAHATGVIHRDIKPSNILLTEEGAPRVTDFGLAKVEDALALSRTGDFAGTPYYMSPEQAASRRIGIDHRTDVFSLGVTLYEMLTLSRPFEGETSHEVLKKILLADPRDPCKVNPRVPQDLGVICLKSMEKMPEARYQTMVEFADDLKRFLNGEMILARPVGAVRNLMRRARRNPAVSWALGVVMLAVVVVILSIPWYVYEMTKAKSYHDTSKESAEESSKEILSLADQKRLNDLLSEANEQLWPAHPEKVGDIKNWKKKARELVADNLPKHRQTLEKWLAQPRDEEDTTAYQWQVETLQKLITNLVAFSDEETGKISKVEKRLEFARRVHEDSIVKQEDQWERAIASIANPEECPKYNRLPIKPQLGLVPIGQDPNPESGLWEFLHLQTGNEVVPVRGKNGKLQLTEKTGLVFVLIPGGTFNMGAQSEDTTLPNFDPEALDLWDAPVRIDEPIEPFFLSKYEMTQGQWMQFTGENPSVFQDENLRYDIKGPNLLRPVDYVSWEDCNDVFSRLKLRFPLEAEWEYACRAGTTTIWWTGNNIESIGGNTPELCAANLVDQAHEDRGWKTFITPEEWDDGYPLVAPVNTFKPNPFGLYNILGNLGEWCNDLAPRGSRRVVRGSCWMLHAGSCRSSSRMFMKENFQMQQIGVRPARSLDR